MSPKSHLPYTSWNNKRGVATFLCTTEGLFPPLFRGTVYVPKFLIKGTRDWLRWWTSTFVLGVATGRQGWPPRVNETQTTSRTRLWSVVVHSRRTDSGSCVSSTFYINLTPSTTPYSFFITNPFPLSSSSRGSGHHHLRRLTQRIRTQSPVL